MSVWTYIWKYEPPYRSISTFKLHRPRPADIPRCCFQLGQSMVLKLLGVHQVPGLGVKILLPLNFHSSGCWSKHRTVLRFSVDSRSMLPEFWRTPQRIIIPINWVPSAVLSLGLKRIGQDLSAPFRWKWEESVGSSYCPHCLNRAYGRPAFPGPNGQEVPLSPVLTISSALPGEINLYFKYGLDSRYLKTRNCSAASSGTLWKECGETERAPARSSEFRRTRKTNRADQGCGSLAGGQRALIRSQGPSCFPSSFSFVTFSFIL